MNRTDFFQAISKATAQIPESERVQLPDWNLSDLESSQMPASRDRDSLWTAFSERFAGVHGEAIDSVDKLVERLAKENLSDGYLDPELNGILKAALEAKGLKLHEKIDTAQIDTCQFGVSRAAGLIAETGTIILKDGSCPSRLGALSPWLHVAILEASTPIYPTLYDAIVDFDNDPYILFATGPSKTADVEGILIEGVHGPGIQICCKA